MTTLPTPEAIRATLGARRAGRNYVLAHHGAMAAALPALHAAYDTMYAALGQGGRLDAFEREFVWVCILAAAREPVGTHHAAQFVAAGGTAAQARVALQLAGYAHAAGTLRMAEEHWHDWLTDIDAGRDYVAGVARLAGDDVPAGLCHLALAATHAILRQEWGVAAIVRAVYAVAAPAEDKLAEALSLVIWPGGVNRFVDACAVWHGLMRDGSVTPSPRFKAWAEAPSGAFK